MFAQQSKCEGFIKVVKKLPCTRPKTSKSTETSLLDDWEIAMFFKNFVCFEPTFK